MASKRFVQARGKVDSRTPHPLDRAVTILKELPAVKFNETVEISVSLNINPKQSDQLVRGTMTLPHGTGRPRRVVVFCKGEKEREASEAGADAVGAEELIQKIQGGWLEFDVAVATPDLMRDVSRLGKTLGPRGMMPNPKTGTVTNDVAKAVKEIKGGKVEFKMDKLGNMHFVIGTLSFQPQQLIENGRVAMAAMVRARPSTFKGRMIRRMSLSSTMSPGIPLKTEGLETAAMAGD